MFICEFIVNNILGSYLRNESIDSGYSNSIVSSLPETAILFRVYKFKAKVNIGKYNHYYICNDKIYLVSYLREAIYNITEISI